MAIKYKGIIIDKDDLYNTTLKSLFKDQDLFLIDEATDLKTLSTETTYDFAVFHSDNDDEIKSFIRHDKNILNHYIISSEKEIFEDLKAKIFSKPFQFNDLLGQLKEDLIGQHALENKISISDFDFIAAKNLLINTVTEEQFSLTEKETAIIFYLYRLKGVPVGKEKLLIEVWGYDPEMTTHTLETHIYRLRQKIGDLEDRNSFLITDPQGYRLNI